MHTVHLTFLNLEEMVLLQEEKKEKQKKRAKKITEETEEENRWNIVVIAICNTDQ